MNTPMQRARELTEFTKWKINLEHFSLEDQDGKEMFVEPRLLKLLNFFLVNANKVIKRTELIDLVWEDVVVTEESLSKAVFDLRKFLNENFKNAPQIVTIRKVGYKMVLQAPPTLARKYRILRRAGKVLAYMISFFLLFSIVIRAIRYEN